jgi:glycosyltransferase involved in cell wall biosynthesis
MTDALEPAIPPHQPPPADTRVAAPSVTVIMPAWNAADTIGASISCVLEQTLAPIDLIVVDDGSTDATIPTVENWIARFPGRIQLLHQDHKGPYPARNLAFSAATGEFVAFLDADDTWSPDCVEKLVHAAVKEDADAAYCGWQNVGPAASDTTPYVPPAYEEADPVDSFLRSCPWPIHAAAVRRTALTAIGGFSERMFTSMDYDLWLRLLAHTRRLVRVPEVMAFYHWRGRQISSDRSRQVMNSIQVRRDFIAANPALVAHLPGARLAELTDGYLHRMAFRAYWSRDLKTAHTLLRQLATTSTWRLRDLPYLALARLPFARFSWLVGLRDRDNDGKVKTQ